MNSPKTTSPPYTQGPDEVEHDGDDERDAAVTIATERLPEKNDSASGSLVSLKRL